MADCDRQAVTAALPLAPATAPASTGAEAEPPPFLLPAEHFAAGLFWLTLGSAALVLIAPDLARGGFLNPRSIAVTHCFTLGVITTSIFGALYQIFPVALGIGARSIRAAHRTFWVLQAGILALVAGAWWWRPALLGLGWVLLAAAVGGMSWNLLPQRRRAPRGRLIGLYISAGHSALGLAMAVVAVRLGNAAGWWNVDRLDFLTAHVHLALVGFATLTVIGVGSRLLPMFLLAHGHLERPLRWIGPALGAGLLGYATGALARWPALRVAGGLAMAVSLTAYLGVAALYFRRRNRRMDPGLAHVALAFLWLGCAVLLGLILLFRSRFDPRLVTVYGLAGLLGWLTLLVIGVYQKIIPFLTWLHRFGTRAGLPDTPTVAQLVTPAFGWSALAAYGAGLPLLALGLARGSGPVATAGAALWSAGTVFILLHHFRLATRR